MSSFFFNDTATTEIYTLSLHDALPILLLDEAYSSLDPNLREKMRDLTIDLQNKYKISMILVTHDKDEAIIFGDRVGIMFGGTIRQIDIPKKLYENPNDIDIAKIGRASCRERV